MKLSELPDWPPKWQPRSFRSAESLTGEIGVLKWVKPLSISEHHVELRIEHDQIEYSGLLRITPIPSTQLRAVLENQGGRSIEEIGKLEIDAEL